MRTGTPLMLGAWAFVERNFRASRRYWGWEVAWLAYSVVTVLAVTYIAPGMQALTGAPASDINFLTIYLLIGTLVWAFLADVFDSTAFMVGWERWEGTIEYTFMAPIRLATMLLGSSVFSVGYAALRSIVVFAIAMLFFKIDLGDANILTAVIFLATGSVGFLGVGITDDGDRICHPASRIRHLLSDIGPARMASGDVLGIARPIRSRGNSSRDSGGATYYRTWRNPMAAHSYIGCHRAAGRMDLWRSRHIRQAHWALEAHGLAPAARSWRNQRSRVIE